MANYLPSVTGDARFKEISLDYGGRGTTCGYLPIWIWWRLGCTDPVLINRTDKSAGLVYKVGMNIAAIVNGGKRLRAWRTLKDGGRPLPGDVVYYANDPPKIEHDADGNPIKNFHEHVNVAIDCSGQEWRTGDAGRTSPAGTQMAEFVTRPMTGADSILYFGGSRKVIGWVDMDAVPLGPPPWDVSVGGKPSRGEVPAPPFPPCPEQG